MNRTLIQLVVYQVLYSVLAAKKHALRILNVFISLLGHLEGVLLLFPSRRHVPLGYLNSLDILRLMAYCIASTEETSSHRMRSLQFILFRQVDLIDSSEGGRRGNYFTYILTATLRRNIAIFVISSCYFYPFGRHVTPYVQSAKAYLPHAECRKILDNRAER